MLKDDYDMKTAYSGPSPSAIAEEICPGFDSWQYELRCIVDKRKETRRSLLP